MSTPHISADKGMIADKVLLPGDPLRARFVAENFLTGAKCYNEVRGMLGFTGTYKGCKVSVQGTGMGQPSISIYANELFNFYGVQKAVRIGTAGALHEKTKLRSIVLAMSASTDSGINTRRFNGCSFAPSADWSLLKNAYDSALKMNIQPAIGGIISSDVFYDEAENWKLWAKYGVLAVEMEAAELYTLAARLGRQALAVLTISDNIATGGQTTSGEREKTFSDMIHIALEAIIKE